MSSAPDVADAVVELDAPEASASDAPVETPRGRSGGRKSVRKTPGEAADADKRADFNDSFCSVCRMVLAGMYPCVLVCYAGLHGHHDRGLLEFRRACVGGQCLRVAPVSCAATGPVCARFMRTVLDWPQYPQTTSGCVRCVGVIPVADACLSDALLHF